MNNQELSMQVVIAITNDGRLSVNGFPKNLQHAQQIIHGANDAINNYFIMQAKDGKLDDKGNVIESKIIPVKQPIIRMDAKQHMGPRPIGKKDGLYRK